jgi:4a-hydroxytetrahydrobiopterin dehydratase
MPGSGPAASDFAIPIRNSQVREERIMTGLATKECVPCKGGVPPLSGEQIKPLKVQLRGWDVIDEHHLTKLYNFSDFVTALAFVNKVGDLAERQGHHPDILLSWGKVRIDIWTHKINGLTESDFILAAKIDELK